MNLFSIDPVSLSLLTGLFYYIVKLNSKIDRYNTELKMLEIRLKDLEYKVHELEKGRGVLK